MLTISGLALGIRATPAIMRQAVSNCAREIEIAVVSEMKLGMTQGVSPSGVPFLPLSWPRIRGGSSPLLDTGILRASLNALATADDLTLSAHAPGARVHQWGAVITAKPGKALAIPLTKAALYAGSPRNFDGLFPVKGGLASEEEKKGRRGKYGTKVKTKIIMQYIFKQSVTIPARPYLGISDPAMQSITNIYVAEAIVLMSEKFRV